MPLLLEPKLVAVRAGPGVHIALEPTLLKLRTGSTTQPCKQTGLLNASSDDLLLAEVEKSALP